MNKQLENKLDGFLLIKSSRKKNFRRFRNIFALLFLLLFAFFYYSYYYRCSLYPAGEGGCEGVTALRLLSGKVPIRDVTLNYNLLWFYPIVLLFKFFGPSYTALRIYFFAMATLTGLLAFWITRKTTHCYSLALLAGIVALLLPGQLFRNYMAFCVMLNMLCFLKTFALPCSSVKKHFLWMIATGCSLGMTFLIRIDLGFFLSSLFGGLLCLYPWFKNQQSKKYSLKKRLLFLFIALTSGLGGFLLFHLPTYFYAEQRGFATPFAAQYQQWPHMIIVQGNHLLETALNYKKSQAHLSYASEAPPQKSTVPSEKTEKSNLRRPSFFSSSDLRERIMTIAVYLPLVCAFLLLLITLLFFTLGFIKKKSIFTSLAWIFLIMLSSSLVLFPQYFFWRPDMVHLSEFMVPMTTTLIVASSLLWRFLRGSNVLLKFLLLLFLLFALANLSIYFLIGIQSQSTGGIAISQGRDQEFVGANGVRVHLTPHEFEETQAIYKSIITHSLPGEYVLCYPYNPEINLMTDRPSYLKNLYCDDMTAGTNFDKVSIEEFEKYHPAVIVVTDWPINGTEHSRFSNWASQTYHYIQSHYKADYQKGIIHVFVRGSAATSGNE